MVKGLILGGRIGEILARQKSDEAFEVGELLIAEDEHSKVLVKVVDLELGSQVSQQRREFIGGLQLEENTSFEFMDPHLRQYTLARLKELLIIRDGSVAIAKQLPSFFSTVRSLKADDVSFIQSPKNALYLGELRSGSKVLPVPISLDGEKVLSHHVLIPATTGRGKSNLLKVLLWNVVDKTYCGSLVLDPHDEYYRPAESLRAHPSRERVNYYSTDPLPATNNLLFSLSDLKPQHFNGVASWSSPQKDALNAFYKTYKKEWVHAIVKEQPLPFSYNEATLGVVRRRIMQLLDLEWDGEKVHYHGIFKEDLGKTTISDICESLERAETVIIDTSTFAGSTEILIGSIITSEIYRRYKQHKTNGVLEQKPVVSVVLEEAPRVLGKEVLERGSNIFATIAREGRKFRVGLLAITQLPSLIPRQILANINTKIILGNEMKPERQAIIESAAQDLSQDDRAIASLDKGEAIVTTNFAPLAVPIKVPLFKSLIPEKTPLAQRSFSGVKL